MVALSAAHSPLPNPKIEYPSLRCRDSPPPLVWTLCFRFLPRRLFLLFLFLIPLPFAHQAAKLEEGAGLQIIMHIVTSRRRNHQTMLPGHTLSVYSLLIAIILVSPSYAAPVAIRQNDDNLRGPVTVTTTATTQTYVYSAHTYSDTNPNTHYL